MDKIDMEEKKKMFELAKERELGGNMDWMYQGDKTNADDFLLGKRVDELLSKTSSAMEDGNMAIISKRIKDNYVAPDIQAKMREDPLCAIRKKEHDARKSLLENPLKMKQLERLVEQQKRGMSKNAKKAKKKKKKSQDNSSDSEDELLVQFLAILKQKNKSGEWADNDHLSKQHRDDQLQKNHHCDKDSSYNKRKREEQPQHKDDHCPEQERGRLNSKSWKDHERKRKQRSDSHQKKTRRYSSDESGQEDVHRQDSSDRDVSKKVYGLIVKNDQHKTSSSDTVNKTESEKVVESRSPSLSNSFISRPRSPERSSHRKDPKRHQSPQQPYKSHRSQSSSRSRSRSPVKRKNLSQPKTYKRQRSASPPTNKRKLTAEERDKKLQEMMDNAKWRDEQRTKNVQQYKEEKEKENSQLETYQGGAKFLSSMMSEHASSSTVEDRLKRNKYNIQRTKAALDKKFTLQ